MDGPLNKAVGEWTGTECRDPIYVDDLNPEIVTYKEFGICHNDYLCVRIAGTNGKGSTTRIVSWTLEEQGYDVGMMSNTSTTNTLTDTIQYNGKKISEEELKEICNQVASVAHNKIEPYGVRTIAALEWFRRNEVDVAVMESGVASRYDATNIVDSDVYAVTNVGKDHIDSVGGDKESIICDFAKADKNTDIIVTNSDRRTARKIKNLSTNDVAIAPDRAELIGPTSNLCFDCEINNDTFTTSLRADYQEKNLNTALEVLEQLSLEVNLASIKKCLRNFRFSGRAELINNQPKILLDGAHNLDGIRSLINTISEFNRDINTVFTALDDKPWLKMLKQLREVSDKVIITKPQGSDRDTHIDNLRRKPEEYVEKPLEAVDRMSSRTNKDGIVLVTGSLYMIREIREYIV